MTLVPDFITPDEEKALLATFVAGVVKRTKGRNSIRRFGSNVPYKGNMVDATVPEPFAFLLDRLVEQGLLKSRPDSVTVNEYLVGQEITPHIDSVTSGEVISVLSLMSDATMYFDRHKHGRHAVHLPARSLVQMRGEIRHDWQHSIAPVKQKRFSMVFRCGKPKNPEYHTGGPGR